MFTPAASASLTFYGIEYDRSVTNVTETAFTTTFYLDGNTVGTAVSDTNFRSIYKTDSDKELGYSNVVQTKKGWETKFYNNEKKIIGTAITESAGNPWNTTYTRAKTKQHSKKEVAKSTTNVIIEEKTSSPDIGYYETSFVDFQNPETVKKNDKNEKNTVFSLFWQKKTPVSTPRNTVENPISENPITNASNKEMLTIDVVPIDDRKQDGCCPNSSCTII